MVDLSTVGIGSGNNKVVVGNVSPREIERELSEDVRSVRSRHPLGCWAIKLGKPSREGVMYAGFSLGVVTTRSAVLSR